MQNGFPSFYGRIGETVLSTVEPADVVVVGPPIQVVLSENFRAHDIAAKHSGRS